MKKNKGITLISLVITIIVLVILSALGIYLALGDNGIINKTEQAKEATLKETATENDIAEGKTAWVNGKLITGNSNNYENFNAVSVSKTKTMNISTTDTYIFTPEDFGFEEIYGIKNVTRDKQYILGIDLVDGNIEVIVNSVTSNYVIDITVTVTAIGK